MKIEERLPTFQVHEQAFLVRCWVVQRDLRTEVLPATASATAAAAVSGDAYKCRFNFVSRRPMQPAATKSEEDLTPIIFRPRTVPEICDEIWADNVAEKRPELMKSSNNS